MASKPSARSFRRLTFRPWAGAGSRFLSLLPERNGCASEPGTRRGTGPCRSPSSFAPSFGLGSGRESSLLQKAFVERFRQQRREADRLLVAPKIGDMNPDIAAQLPQNLAA